MEIKKTQEEQKLGEGGKGKKNLQHLQDTIKLSTLPY